MTRSRIALPVLAVLLIAACARQFTADGRVFNTTEEALAYVRSKMDQLIAKVEPLDAPIAGPPVMVLPTREHAKALVRVQYPDIDPELLAYYAEGGVIYWDTADRAIKRRNIFTEVQTVHADNPQGIEAPRGGYLMWIEAQTRKVHFFHMLAAGETETTEIKKLPESATKEPTGRLFDFSGIENFVRTHRPNE